MKYTRRPRGAHCNHGGIPVQKTLTHWLGLLGVISFLSYLSAVVFSPLAYPGYHWMQQAVSDLSAADAPSRVLWGQLSCLYGICGLVSLMAACIFVQGRLNRALRLGVYLFTAMNWVSYIGYLLFPLTSSGYAGTFQDAMHAFVVTPLVVLLSIASLIFTMVGGFRRGQYPALAVCAAVALGLMFTGAIGTGAAPKAIFGVFERFSTLSAAAFTMVLGVALFRSFRGFQPRKQDA